MRVRITANVSYHTKLVEGDVVEIDRIDHHFSRYTGRDVSFYYVKGVTFNGGDEPFYLIDREFEIVEEAESMKQTKIINIIGAPGAGKSTLAARIFYELKARGLSAEIVTEYTKDLVYEERAKTFDDELYIFAKQNHRLFRCVGKVDYVVTDAPIVQKLYYQPAEFDFRKTVIDVFNQYDNVNLLLKREGFDYETNARINSEKESEQIHRDMMALLDEYDVEYREVSHSGVDSIISEILEEALK